MTPNYQVYIVNAFTSEAFKGSPVCVVFLRNIIDIKQMQSIAGELKQPKTVFVYQADREIFKMRYFSPSQEIDLCINSTIAAFWVLTKLGYLDENHQDNREITLFTNQEKLKVGLEFSHHKLESIYVTQPKGTIIGQPASMKRIMVALGLSPKNIGYIEPVIATTGIPTLLLNLRQKSLVQGIQPDMTALQSLSEDENFDAINLYHISKDKKSAYQRSFMPKLGIPTEPATATSTAALHYALTSLGTIDAQEFTLYSGNELGRPSKIESRIDYVKGENRVVISGRASMVIEGVMNF